METHTLPDASELAFVTGFLADIPKDASPDLVADQEAEVLRYVQELEDLETRRYLINALAVAIKTRGPEFDDLVYGAHPLIEITAAELPRLGQLTERLLAGKNAAIVVRAGTYEDFDREVLEPVWAARRFRWIDEEEFPRAGNVPGHSGIHLDYFDKAGADSHFPYDLSMSRTDVGSVVFIAGLASRTAYGWEEAQYQRSRAALNTSNRIVGMKRQATDKTSPRGPGYTEWEPGIKGVQDKFIATPLNEGDVVIWAQGGLDAERPTWHGFFQIGHPDHPHFVARHSTSYHMYQETPTGLPYGPLQRKM